MRKIIPLIAFIGFFLIGTKLYSTNPLARIADESLEIETNMHSSLSDKVKSLFKKTTGKLSVKTLAKIALGTGLGSVLIWGLIFLGVGFNGVVTILLALATIAIITGIIVRRRSKEKSSERRKLRKFAFWGIATGLLSWWFTLTVAYLAAVFGA